MKKYILALDQGTTSSRAVVFDLLGNKIGAAAREIVSSFPHEGWVEQDPLEIYSSQVGVMSEVLGLLNIGPEEILTIGITNQRETTVIWDRKTGLPVYNALVWQCRRTADICEELKQDASLEEYVRRETGLRIDAYFSATKIMWILDHVERGHERARAGELLFGTIDTWLIWKLTKGRVFKTDRTNASRTMLFNIREGCWDNFLLERFKIPKVMLGEVQESSADFGSVNIGGLDIPITGVAGDQQAALFGQRCFEPGEVKNTYGTGCFLLMNTGREIYYSKEGLLTTLTAASGPLEYAIEGSVFTGGAVISWLRDELGLISSAEESLGMALSVPDTAGVYLVPAFTGLGSPYWDMYARGTILGLTRGAKKAHIVRAALESIAFQCQDLLESMEKDTGIVLKSLKVDGGASANDFLMAFQADISGCPVERADNVEATALGAMYLAALGLGVFKSIDDIKKIEKVNRVLEPTISQEERLKKLKGWKKAIEQTKGWNKEE